MKRTKVLFAVSECVPFIKTGGLADVAGSLPKNFNSEKYDVRVMMPNYACIKEPYRKEMKKLLSFRGAFNWQIHELDVYSLVLNGVTFYFLDSGYYFGGPWPYGNMADDIEKFSFFDRMLLTALPEIGFQPDIIHCHDWQTGLIPVYLDESFRENPFYRNIRTVFTIHNLKYQGSYDIDTMIKRTGLSPRYFTTDKLEAYGNGSMMKGGLVYADRITTVSETYAHEIRTPFYGEGLDGLLRYREKDLCGIVNGIDFEYYDPETDSDIPVNYTAENVFEAKAENKKLLQRELGLREDPDVFLVGIVSRLTGQKGLDMIYEVMNEIISDEKLQLVVLGTGEERYENMFRDAANAYPDRVTAEIYYSEALSHRIYASCDAFLMPSLFEPCGLSQLMSLRYGTLPIVRETGGLKDTVKPYNEYTGEGTGFSFANYNAQEMLMILRYAERTFFEKRDAWNVMVKRAMAQDFSWGASAGEYEKLYDGLTGENETEA